MIFVKELDDYLRAFFYWINFNFYEENIPLPNEIKAWRLFLNSNSQAFKDIEDSAEKFGFRHDVSGSKGMMGNRQIATKRMNFFLPFNGLRIYPRLLYSEGYLPKPKDFDMHRYFFTYYPKTIMPFFRKKQKWEVIGMTTHWTIGTHRYLEKTKEHLIAYNVSVPVNLATIIEEELHAIEKNVHGTTKRVDVLKAIEKNDPDLRNEIERNLKHILSAEEKRFWDFGDLIREEHAPEIRKLETFCNIFEKKTIEHGTYK